MAIIDVDKIGRRNNRIRTDLDPEEASERITAMYEFAIDAGQLTHASKFDCMITFATIAVGCGAAAFPPAAPPAVIACIASFSAALCKCGKYLPINVCK